MLIEKHILKNLLKNKSHIIVLFLLTFLTSFMYFFVKCSIDKNIVNLSHYTKAQNLEDFRFLASDSTLKSLESKYNFSSEKRVIKKITQNNKNYYFINLTENINLPYLINGKLPRKDNDITLLPQFLENNNMKIGDTIELNNAKYTIVGTIYLPDYQGFTPHNNLTQDYSESTFALTTSNSLDNISVSSEIYYCGKFLNNNIDKHLLFENLKNDPSFTYLESSENISSDSEFLNGLNSNTVLARTFLFIFSLITILVFYMFYKRFLNSYKSDFGIFVALGFKNNTLSLMLTKFSLLVSIPASILGLIIGYISSSVLINTNADLYSFPYFARGVNLQSIIEGTLLVVILLALLTYFIVYKFINLDTCNLINNIGTTQSNKKLTTFINFICKIIPNKFQLSFRIIFRKFSYLFLSGITILIISTLCIMSYSLYTSSSTLISNQTLGINYKYDFSFNQYQTEILKEPNVESYLKQPLTLYIKDNSTPKINLLGISTANNLFKLYDKHNNKLSLSNNDVIINESLSVLYNLNIGENITLTYNNKDINFTVTNICKNGDANSVYIPKSKFTSILGIPSNSYNGVFSNKEISNIDANKITLNDKINALNTTSVSNRSSAVICQVLSFVVAVLMIFLVLLLTFQDNTRDMLILDLLGYKPKEINNLLINIYRPVFSILFLITLPIAIYISKMIHINISIGTNDFIPFSTNIFILIGIFLLIHLIYTLVLFLFNKKIRNLTSSESIKL